MDERDQLDDDEDDITGVTVMVIIYFIKKTEFEFKSKVIDVLKIVNDVMVNNFSELQLIVEVIVMKMEDAKKKKKIKMKELLFEIIVLQVLIIILLQVYK
ncbi:MAG: hypothetical protein EZS28_007973 [Streblomastix strix]|uniref:Uncharacterized protein n=1 Tax=Streblomastix strix TaxID=222440 RepID=A0A5J4WPG0_9EUKA|nr:MAG: hypothetical protein EZS28_007973 [Streblomastix strix]